jgi:hypothetical protein
MDEIIKEKMGDFKEKFLDTVGFKMSWLKSWVEKALKDVYKKGREDEFNETISQGEL